MLIVQPHHDGSTLYVPEPIVLGQPTRLRIRVPQAWGTTTRIWIRSVQDGEPRYNEATKTSDADGWAWWEGQMLVVNPVAHYRFFIEADGRYWSLNAEGLFSRDVSDYSDFRVTAFNAAPEWLHRSTLYQIFPDRYARSAQADTHPTPDWAIACAWNTPVQGTGPQTSYQFYGGDLPGITEKLDHIQSLGADIVYLTPFFPARSNHRYDASTFTAVDPLLGGDQALVDLVEAAHARGIRVMGDLTANHSGAAHEWFVKALAEPNSEEAGYYYFNADHTKYESWWGVPSLPKLNWSSEALRRRFVLDDDSVVARWLKPPFNLDGWRIDVGNMTGRLGSIDVNHEVARLIANRVREINPNAALLAESTSDAAPDFDGEHWQGAMTYSNFTRPLWSWLATDAPEVNFFGTPLAGANRINAEDFLATHADLVSDYSWPVRSQNMNALNTHDTARAATVMIDGCQSLAAVLMFTMPGVPVMFAGDEFGLKGFNGEESRTPMPWPELPAPAVTVNDLRANYSALTQLRREHSVLTEGGIRWIYAQGDLLGFVRESVDAAMLVLVARAASEIELDTTVLSQAQLTALEAAPAFSAGTITATKDPATGTLKLRTESLAAAVWTLPGVEN
ncbi:glycoside hydrolase family 13 protein [Pseudarthrobacter sp. J1738]|uniref:glycoside hydrolase family 13 protein n=1 Tax=Pseudarthrobacter sp. J1738 TaxID=3420446 RepID=UPI003D2D97D0